MKLRLQDFKRTEEKSAIEMFRSGIKAKATRRSYTSSLRNILCNILEDILDGSFEDRAQQLVDRTRKDPKWTVDLILNIVELYKKRTSLPKDHPERLDPVTPLIYLSPIKKLLDMNDLTAMPWKRIYSTVPELVKSEKGRGYIRDEIECMVESTSNPTLQGITLTAASSGIRAGAFDFEWRDMTPVYMEEGNLTLKPSSPEAEIVCVAILIYRGYKQEYLAFITPEAYDAILEHKKRWVKRVGREPRPDDPVFIEDTKEITALTESAVRQKIMRLTIRIGIRSEEKKRKHEIPAMNGFRRFWDKTVKDTKSIDVIGSLIKKEYMMGHEGMLSLDKNYYQAMILELAREYLTVVPNLTITEEYRLKMENKRLHKQCEGALQVAKDVIEERDEILKSLKREQKNKEKEIASMIKV